jgi:uncharacterized protein
MDTADVATGGHAGYSGACPFTVDKPVMRQRWERLTFLHWPYDPADVQRLLPGGLTVDTFDGHAWVGLVPFFMRVHTPGDRGIPWVSNFCETNVRTYARDREGRTGIWFLSLDAARLGAVAVARASYQLPYFWSSMRLTGPVAGQAPAGSAGPAADEEVAYSGRRRLPGPLPAASHVRVRVGAPYQPAELGDRDHFLTARWVLFSVLAGRQFFARAEHAPWPLYRAEPVSVNDGLIAAAGLPAPRGEPLVHYSPGVDVRIGRPERYRGPAGNPDPAQAG